MKKLILNADDFGFSIEINQSIVDAYDHGIVTSTTMLVFRGATTQAVELAKLRPGLRIGLHLDLDRLFEFDEHGHFGITVTDIDLELYKYYTIRKIGVLEAEIDRQIEQIKSYGITPTHLDGHHHVHMFPDILPHVVKAVSRHGIDKIRFSKGFYTQHQELYSITRQILRGANIKFPDFCRDFGEELPVGKILENINSGVTELVVHTALPDFESEHWRVDQYRYLTSREAADAIHKHNIKLATFLDL